MKLNIIHNESCLIGLSKIDSCSVNTCVTSPPYYGLRDYGVDGQIGLEETPEEFIQNLVDVFREVRRVLKDDGTLWVNIGDTYYGGETQPGGGSHNGKHLRSGTPPKKKIIVNLKRKDLIGIPWMLAFALRADGWYLRQDIIWHKPNPMPESVTDRCTKSHEYIFLLSKSHKYYFDAEAIKQIAKNPEDDKRRMNQQSDINKSNPTDKINGLRPRSSGNKERKNGSERVCPENSGSNVCGSVPWTGELANKRSVWSVNKLPFKEAHFATFPEKLIVDCIKAGCPVGGIVLDPFMGAGTTAIVSQKLERNYIGFEINPDYIKICNDRINSIGTLFTPNQLA